MIIAIDFDGTICLDKYPEIGQIQPGAQAAINELYANGHYIILNTCRAGETLTEAINWLLEKGIPFNRVVDNNPDMTAKYGPTRKVFAHVYIDDRNLGGFPGWEKAMLIINELNNGRI